MMKTYRKIILRYLITTVAAGALTLLVLSLHGFYEAETLMDKYRILADAFTIPGLLLIMVAALIWVSTTGFFDGLSYAVRQFGGMVIPFFKHKHQNYYDYKMSRDDKRVKGYGFLLFVGLAFFAVAIVFTILHSIVYVPTTPSF